MEPKCYDDLVNKFRMFVCNIGFSEQLKKIVSCYKTICYSMNVMQQTACMVVGPVMVENFASSFNHMMLSWATD